MPSSPKMRTTLFFLVLAFHSLGALCQTITHITQISIFTDLRSCLTNAIDQVYDDLRANNCPQTNPTSAASCLCLKTANSAAISSKMSNLVPIWCGGLGSNAGDRDDLFSGLAAFSEYCTEALGTVAAGAGATPASNTPVETGAGRITSSALISGATDTSSNTPNNSPTTSNAPNSSPTISNAPNNSPTTSSSSSSTSSGLSLGEKLAIGVTIPASLAAIVGCYFAWRQHQRGKKEAEMRQAAFQQAQYSQEPPSYQLVTRNGY